MTGVGIAVNAGSLVFVPLLRYVANPRPPVRPSRCWFEQALRHKDQELVAMKQKNSRLIKESTKEGKSRVKVSARSGQ